MFVSGVGNAEATRPLWKVQQPNFTMITFHLAQMRIWQIVIPKFMLVSWEQIAKAIT